MLSDCSGLSTINFQPSTNCSDIAWAVARGETDANVPPGKWTPEIGKRAVVFAWWTRAVSNDTPENDFEPYMAAQFAFVDATVSGDEIAIKNADHLLERWQKYGG